jgi:hypothetical protein
MNEQDLRDCFAMFKAMTGASAEECYKFADEMLEAREAKGTVGLPPVRARKTKEK